MTEESGVQGGRLNWVFVILSNKAVDQKRAARRSPFFNKIINSHVLSSNRIDP